MLTGDVHGVYFRDTCRRTAQMLDVAGWVRNRFDGTVEAVFEGAPDDVDRLVEWTRHGPDLAVVDNVQAFDEDPEGLSGFEIRPTA